MSGGHYDFAYSKLERFAESLRLCDVDGVLVPERQRFVQLLADVAVAMRAVEWVDSGDCLPGDELESIRRVLRFEEAIRQHKMEFERLKLNPDAADYDLWKALDTP